MGSYREGAIVWQQTHPVTVDATGWTSGAKDIEWVVPTQLDEFWAGIDDNGAELRVLDHDGTKLTYKLTTAAGGTFNATAKANRDAKIAVSSYTPTAAAKLRISVAWNAPGASSGASAFTPSSPLSAIMAKYRPAARIAAVAERPGSTRPPKRIQKAAAEVVFVEIDMSAFAATWSQRYAGGTQFGGLRYVTYTVELAGAAQAGMVEADSPVYTGPAHVAVKVKAGQSGTSYTLVLVAVMSTGETKHFRAQIDVRNTSEA